MASIYIHSKLFKQRSFYTHREAFTHNKLLHREAFTHSKLSHTASVYTENTCTQCFYTWQAFTHTQKLLHRDALTHTQKLLHTTSFYTEKLLHTASFYRKKFLHKEAFLYIITTGIAAPNPDLDAKVKERRF